MRQRYTNFPFPSYAFVPGVHPHPNRDPKGHSYNEEEPPMTDQELYLWGLDLFNYEFYWEAHEAWEGIWKTHRGETKEALFFQSLIQLAACCLKRILGSEEGVQKLSKSALERLNRVASQVGDEFRGMLLSDIRTAIESVVNSQEFTPPLIRLRLEPK